MRGVVPDPMYFSFCARDISRQEVRKWIKAPRRKLAEVSSATESGYRKFSHNSSRGTLRKAFSRTRELFWLRTRGWMPTCSPTPPARRGASSRSNCYSVPSALEYAVREVTKKLLHRPASRRARNLSLWKAPRLSGFLPTANPASLNFRGPSSASYLRARRLKKAHNISVYCQKNISYTYVSYFPLFFS